MTAFLPAPHVHWPSPPRYADRQGIPYVWFPTDRDTESEPGAAPNSDVIPGDVPTLAGEVKDTRSGAQAPADAASWAPSAADLAPTVERVTEQGTDTG